MREPKNYITNAPYTGGNCEKLLAQSESEFFMTFAQGMSIGKVVKGKGKGIRLFRPGGKPFTVFPIEVFIDRDNFKKEVFKDLSPVEKITKAISVIDERKAAEKATIKPVKAVKSKAKKEAEFEETPPSKWCRAYVCSGIVYMSDGLENHTAISRTDLPDGCIAQRASYKEVLQLLEEGITNIDIENVITLPKLGEHLATLSIEIMKELSVFASADKLKPTFNAVYFGGGHYVASDSRRMSVIKAEPIFISDSKMDFIIPLDIVKQAKSDIEIYQELNSTRIVVKSKNSFTRLVDGQFPNWEEVIPKEKGTLVTVEKDALDECKAKAKQPSFKMVVSKDGISYLSSVSGQMVKTKFIPTFSAETPEMGFNSSYMLDALKFTGENTFSVVGAMSPVVYRSDDEVRTAVVMPILIKQPE